MRPTSLDRFCEFLIEAKRRSYAGPDEAATMSEPVLSGSKQLEYREGDLSYRDIYFGMSFFVGQETVRAGLPVIWSMTYAGGVVADVTGRTAFQVQPRGLPRGAANVLVQLISARFARAGWLDFGTGVTGVTGATSRLVSGDGASSAIVSVLTGATFISPSRARTSDVNPG